MHVKSDSEASMSIEASTPQRSPRRALYYVQSPSHSQNDLEKMSYGSSPFASPAHHHFQYHCSPIHHSRESSTSRFSASLKHPKNFSGAGAGGWRMMQKKYNDAGDFEEDDGEEEEDGKGDDGGQVMRFYVVCFVFSFVVLFTIFSLILWAASLSYKPTVIVKSISFEKFKIQAGMDASGVPTDMLSLNSTVRILYDNPSTFFGVHVSSTPPELHYFGLKVASGHIKGFYQVRQSYKKLIAVVEGDQVPLYGAMTVLVNAKDQMTVPLSLRFVMRSRAYILGRLVKTKFYGRVECKVTFRANVMGKPLNLTTSDACIYR